MGHTQELGCCIGFWGRVSKFEDRPPHPPPHAFLGTSTWPLETLYEGMAWVKFSSYTDQRDDRHQGPVFASKFRDFIV